MELPMLTEEEWALVSPHLSNMISEIKEFRQKHGASLAEALEVARGREALAIYERLTGFKETNVDALYHHRISLYGPPCRSCGKPLRTPQARCCAMCGVDRDASPT